MCDIFTEIYRVKIWGESEIRGKLPKAKKILRQEWTEVVKVKEQELSLWVGQANGERLGQKVKPGSKASSFSQIITVREKVGVHLPSADSL